MLSLQNNWSLDRIYLGWYAVLMINCTLWDKRVTRQTKQNIYKTVIKNIVCFGIKSF
jgi:hypothetical protein